MAAGSEEDVEHNFDIEQVSELVQAWDEFLKDNYDEAERRLLAGFERSKQIKAEHPKERDVVGWWKYAMGLTSMVRGMMTLQNNQLAEATRQLQEADAFGAAERPVLLGTRLLQGQCKALIGILLVMQGAYVKGLWNILYSGRFMKGTDKEVEHFEVDGMNTARSINRSTALFSFALTNLLLSMLPPNLLSMATWVMSGNGDRERALQLLCDVWREGGSCAPFAALCYLGFMLDTSTFLGEDPRPEDYALCWRMLESASERYPGSMIFGGLEAKYRALVQHDIPAALGKALEIVPKAEQYPAMAFIAHINCLLYARADFQWAEAAAHCAKAIDVYTAVKRRSFVPALAMDAVFLYSLQGELDKAKEMLLLCRAYRGEAKRDWGRQDVAAFAAAEQCPLADSQPRAWHPELYEALKLTTEHRAVSFMSTGQVDRFLELLRERMGAYASNPDLTLWSLFAQAEAQRMARRFSEALDTVERALALERSLPAASATKSWGFLPYLHYIRAASLLKQGKVSPAKEALERSCTYGKKYTLYDIYNFKAGQLSKELGVEVAEMCKRLAIGARQDHKLCVEVNPDVGEVSWDFTVESHSIGFQATFTPQGGEAAVVQSVQRHEQASGPLVGNFTPEQAGTLELTFFNNFSMMRSKTIFYRIAPEGLKVT